MGFYKDDDPFRLLYGGETPPQNSSSANTTPQPESSADALRRLVLRNSVSVTKVGTKVCTPVATRLRIILPYMTGMTMDSAELPQWDDEATPYVFCEIGGCPTWVIRVVRGLGSLGLDIELPDGLTADDLATSQQELFLGWRGRSGNDYILIVNFCEKKPYAR